MYGIWSRGLQEHSFLIEQVFAGIVCISELVIRRYYSKHSKSW